MRTQLNYAPADAGGGVGRQPLADAARRILGRVIEGIEVCADYAAAAAMHEDLSRLSDAELKRRGLSRETLARDVVAACDRSERGR